jgi:decaprenyl-phosphate phosphoribosyltransferase
VGGAGFALLRTLRPHQWVKNGFVAAALVFSKHLTESAFAVRTALAIAAFCALSGAVYAFNDVRDVEADRAHPKKRNRPIASGLLSERAALTSAAILAIGALGGCFVLDWRLGVVASIYLAQNVAYSVRLKHVAFLDVGLIAGGFVLRVLAGAYAIDVPASSWIMLCTALLAIFLGLGKRAHELSWAERSGNAATTRAALAGYSLGIVRVAMYGLAAITCAAYSAYTLYGAPGVFGTDRLIFSAPFVALGIVRYLSLALWRPRDDSPTEAMFRDPLFLLDLAAATAVVLYIIYG